MALIDHGADVSLVRSRADDDRPATMVDAMTRTMLGLLSPAGMRARLSILIFHRVHAQPDPLFPFEMHAATFSQRMAWMRRWFNVMPLAEAISALSAGRLPSRALAITFDDGYADNFTVALPILRQLGLHATFFIASSFIDGGRMWNDTAIEAIRAARGDELDLSPVGLGVYSIVSPESRARAIGAILPQLKYLSPAVRQDRVDAIASLAGATLPTDMMMTSAQVRGLAAAGMTIGAHTGTHPILARLDEMAARREIADGRDALEAVVTEPIKLFAYPNGKPGTDYTAAHVRITHELGFNAAVSTSSGVARTADAVFELPRFTPWGRSSARWRAELARNMFAVPVRASP